MLVLRRYSEFLSTSTEAPDASFPLWEGLQMMMHFNVQNTHLNHGCKDSPSLSPLGPPHRSSRLLLKDAAVQAVAMETLGGKGLGRYREPQRVEFSKLCSKTTGSILEPLLLLYRPQVSLSVHPLSPSFTLAV